MKRKMISFFLFLQIMEHPWNKIDRGKTEVLGGKTCPSATLSTTNPTWTNPGSNLGLPGGRAATNRLSHGTATTRDFLYNSRVEDLLNFLQKVM
jgi:hypothetical protein